jgi:redox-sensitive bicupin YhaK (pirin superfamily)
MRMRLLMGTAYGVTLPLKTFADTLYLEAHMTTGQTFQLPQCEQIVVYVASGSIRINNREISQYSMAILEDCASVSVHALQPAALLL